MDSLSAIWVVAVFIDNWLNIMNTRVYLRAITKDKEGNRATKSIKPKGT